MAGSDGEVVPVVQFGGHQRIVKPDPGNADAWVTYDCHACGARVNGAVVARPAGSPEFVQSPTRWLWCNACGAPAVRDDSGVIRPGVRYGPHIEGLPADVEAAYHEARDCMSVSAYTGAELLCRKILMYVAVHEDLLEAKNEKGRAPSFEQCVDAMAQAGYVTPPMKPWVDRIRTNANDATHELEPPTKGRAESTVTFTAQMLTNMYAMRHLADKHASPATNAEEEDEPGT